MSEILASFLEQYQVLLFVDFPELLRCLPRLQMHVPDGLAMCVVDTKTSGLNFVVITVFSRVRVDVV